MALEFHSLSPRNSHISGDSTASCCLCGSQVAGNFLESGNYEVKNDGIYVYWKISNLRDVPANLVLQE